jgi:hypothetical protein
LRGFGAALRGLAAFAATRLGAAFFAVFVGFLDVFLAATARFFVGGLLIGPSF